ncbi:MAG: hypothetical protein K2Y27_04090 [Xanthobacteraceae bacterium]|nr:hypothetical protein [Xanthobacteraceae bacterium]
MPLSQNTADRRASSLTFADISKFAQQQAEAFIQMQRDLGKLAEDTNRNWIARIEAERDLATNLASKLSAAKTILDTVNIYQEWTGERLRLLAEDTPSDPPGCKRHMPIELVEQYLPALVIE